jgi:radical SAM protein with 4Fe4S-binding SPASM domain
MDFPREIILEVTNRCNLRCVMCHYHGKGVEKKREPGDMKPEVWEKVLDEIKEVGKEVVVLTHGAGEPLLNKDLLSLLEKAGKIPCIHLGFMTNGMALTPDFTDKLLETGISSLAFSVDGVDPKLHAKYRRGSDLAKIEANINYLIKRKKELGLSEPDLMFNMVGLEEILPQEEQYVDRWLPHAGQVFISKYRTVGSRALDNENLPEPRTLCSHLENQFVISWDGRVGLCCEDIFCEVETGDVTRQSIKEIWNGPVFNKIRKAQGSGDFSSVPLCSNCDTWAAGEILNQEQVRAGVHCKTTPGSRIYTKI